MVAIKFLFPSGESAMRKRVVINYPKSPHQHPTVLVGARIAINTVAWSFNTNLSRCPHEPEQDDDGGYKNDPIQNSI